MTDSTTTMNRRILVIDDQEMIHDDFRKILTPPDATTPDFDSAKAALFGDSRPAPESACKLPAYELDFAIQGEIGLQIFESALAQKRPHAVAFVDMRMPPGWDGLKTIQHLWGVSADLEVVICTAYSDYSWDEVVEKIGNPDRLLILKKPFDTIEVLQLANALTQKWTATRQAHATLEEVSRMVEERTRDLETARDELVRINRHVVQAHQAAERANRSKAEFLTNVSHEIRTPMTAICGYVELIQNTCPPTREFCEQQLPEYLSIITRNSDHLLLLIDDLLDLSKIEAGKLEIMRTACSPFNIIEDVRTLLSVKAADKGLAFDVTYKTPIPLSIETDPLRFRQILLNLTSNAIKFTAEGGVGIVASLDEAHAEPRLRVDVTDTGIGMTEAQMTRIFQPFTQADASVTRRYGGTGMGLAISQRLAEMLNGGLSVSSNAGVGSTFRVEIATGPLQGIERADMPPQENAGTAPNPAKTDVRLDCDILLAEDGKDNQRLISHFLKTASARVTVVENGQEAVDEALRAMSEGQPYAVILMDMQMPVMDGYTAVRTLRERGYKHPILALTAHAMTASRDECMQAGCDDFLSKPIKRDALLKALAVWLKRQSPAVCPS